MSGNCRKPFVTVLGPESSGHFRLNLAQTFNSFGAIIAVVFGQSLILSNVPHQSQDVLDKMSPEQLSAYKHSLVLSVQTPYMIIVAIVLLVALLIMLTKFPALQSDNHSDAKQGSFSASLSRLARIRHWRWAVLAQFCYVGAQTACWSYLIRYAVEEIPGMTAGFAANYLTGTMVCFFIGRFTGTAHQSLRTTQSPGRLRINRYGTVPDLSLRWRSCGLNSPDFMQRLYVDSVPNNLLAGH